MSPPMSRTRLTVAGDGAPLAATLDLPAGRPTGFALLAHCFTCSKDHTATTRIARGLTNRGLAVLRVDFTGLGGSGGRFADSTFTANIADLVRAADLLRAEFTAPTLLIGHSLGGAAVLAAASLIPEVRAVATIGAPDSPDHVASLFDAARPDDAAHGDTIVNIGGRPFRVDQAFLADISGQPQHDRIATLALPLLVLHSPDDDIVAFDHARRIVATAGTTASLVVLDGADHLLTRPADADRVAALIAAWASPYLDRADTDTDRADSDRAVAGIKADPESRSGTGSAPQPGTVEVTESGIGPFAQRIRTASHEWAADEPRSAGGSDTAPDPYQLLLSALGACTSMTMRMYAQRKGWDLRATTVTLTHDRMHATDCSSCATSSGLLDRIVREIHLDGDLDDAQRAGLLAIADRCPVHRTLLSEIVIETDPV